MNTEQAHAGTPADAAGEGLGPLSGVRVVEIAGKGPGPFCAMVLADLGAHVIRVERPGHRTKGHIEAIGGLLPDNDVVTRGRQIVEVDLKTDPGRERLLALCMGAAVLVEGFRPGVMERLDLGPDEVLARNPALVYARLTGYGQFGPLAQTAGHDINYLAASGVLSLLAREGERPLAPLNLLGDFGGGGMVAAFGILGALYESSRSGRGQVVDAAMVDGVALLAAKVHGLRTMATWSDEAGTNFLDSGAPYYDTFETADGRYVAVGALEEQFYVELLDRLGIPGVERIDQNDRARWPELRRQLSGIFASRTRDEWTEAFDGADACVTPVLSLDEAAQFRHNVVRSTYVDSVGLRQPAAAPRFSRTPARAFRPASTRLDDEQLDDLIRSWSG